MRRDELAGPSPFFRIAKARLQLALQVVYAHPVSQPGCVILALHAVQFADVEVTFAVEANAVGTMDIVPHGEVVAFGSKT